MSVTFRTPRKSRTPFPEHKDTLVQHTRPGTLAWQERLTAAWNCGLEEMDQETTKYPSLGNDGNLCPTPYHYVLEGFRGMLEYALFPGQEFSLIEIEERWGEVIRRVPTNADPTLILRELRMHYPNDFYTQREKRGD